ncbi:MAG: sarcosine oxidase subunit gamma [Hyphomicrobiales bacterium]
MLERRSALASAIARGGRDGASGRRQCRLGEVTGWSLVQVAAFPSTMAALEERLEAIIGELPFGCHSMPAETTIFRTGPHQFWIVGKDASLTDRLSEAIAPDIGVVTPLSDSRVRIFVEGDCATDVLSKGIPIDLHPSVFKVGRMALSGLHHTPILIHRAGERRFEIYAMRTFALTVWEWLADAALEFGYEVGSEGDA